MKIRFLDFYFLSLSISLENLCIPLESVEEKLVTTILYALMDLIGMSNRARSCENVSSHMQTTKVQISLRIGAVWSAPLLFAA